MCGDQNHAASIAAVTSAAQREILGGDVAGVQNGDEIDVKSNDEIADEQAASELGADFAKNKNTREEGNFDYAPDTLPSREDFEIIRARMHELVDTMTYTTDGPQVIVLSIDPADPEKYSNVGNMDAQTTVSLALSSAHYQHEREADDSSLTIG